jgi:hypothetical protein
MKNLNGVNKRSIHFKNMINESKKMLFFDYLFSKIFRHFDGCHHQAYIK